MDAERAAALSTEELDARIRAAGLRSTRQRLTVLAVLDGDGGHRSADELVGELADRGTALPRSTVFNVLDDLVEAGLVMRADLGSGATRFESALSNEPHHHFVCVACGTIQDVPAEEPVTRLGDPSRRAGNEVESIQVVVRGRCRACGPGAGR